MNLPKNVLYYGRPEPLPEQIGLRAGPLALIFEAGDLRAIRFGDVEVVRRVYVTVRDHVWNTIPVTVSNLQLDARADSFCITFDAKHKQGAIDFAWRATLTGDARGAITFEMDGVARSTFKRNRIGICVLHPIRECAGQACLIEKPDGTKEPGAFPRSISPHQPFTDLRAITYQVAPNVSAEIRFVGEVFEMEDQRNWTDASFKTYSTPLRVPYPVEVQAGTRIKQVVTISLNGQVTPPVHIAPNERVIFSIGDAPVGKLPLIGLGVASHREPLNATELARLRQLNLSHLRVGVHLAEKNWREDFERAWSEARALGIALEVALFVSDAAARELNDLITWLEQFKPQVCAWLIFHAAEKSTTEKWIRLVREHLARFDPHARIGAGSNIYFTELNRARPPVAALDLVCYALNPQVHLFDNHTLVENLLSQAETVASARAFAGGLPIAITPITLKKRFNPSASQPQSEINSDELPDPVDPRQMSLLGAGWTLASIKHIAESGIASATYYETTGWRGVMETERGARLPDQFHSLPGSVFPMYHVFADVGEFAGGDVLPAHSSDALRVEGMALRRGGWTRVIIANLTGDLQRIQLQNAGKSARVRYLDETNVVLAMQSPAEWRAKPSPGIKPSDSALECELPPYSLIVLDMEGQAA